MTRRSLVLVASTLVLLGGCAQLGMHWWAEAAPTPSLSVPPTPGATPWTGTEPLDDPSSFHFAVVSDRTGEHRDGVFAAAMPRVNLLQPAFVVSVGDLIEGYTDDADRLAREWDEIEGYVGQLEMPFFYAAGNHDMSNAAMAEAWQQRFGPSYYDFRYKGVHFVVLNSELFAMVHDPSKPVPGPYTQAAQMAWVEEALAANREARWTFVIIHQPLWDSPKIHPDWLRVEELLGERPYTVFAGHYHRYTRHKRRGRDYVTLATTGGGSRLRGTPWGEFDHVAFVRVGKDEPVIANVVLDGVLPVDVRDEAFRRQVSQMAEAIVPLPLVGAGATFRKGRLRLQISNPLDRPLEIEGRIEGSEDLEPGVARVSREVAAGGVIHVEVPLRARAPVPYERLAPARAHFTLRAAGPDGAPIEIEVERALAPDGRFRVGRGQVTLDGDLSEWGTLRYVADAPAEIEGHGLYRGSQDASFRFDLRQDAERLYLAVQVVDDSVVASAAATAREQDHVLVSLDARPERAENGNLFAMIRAGALRKMVTSYATLGPARPDPILSLFAGGGPEVGPSPVETASLRTADGYAVELAVPHSRLDEHAGGAWQGLRLNLTVSDFDEGEPDHMNLSWRPSRFGGGAAEGAGSISRR